MIIKNRNFSFIQPDLADGDILRDCNLSQAKPGTEIGKGIKGLVFADCNLINCKVPDDARVIGCNLAQIDRCTHLHPEYIERGLKACPEDCRHRQGSQKQWVVISEQEFKKHKDASLEPNTPAIRVGKENDSYGITVHTFEKEVYTYKDAVL